MKSLLCFFLVLLFLSAEVKADHITGGEIYYTASSNGINTYNATFKVFMRCSSGRQFNNPTIVSVFDKGTNQRFTDISVNLSSTETIQITSPDPCISDPPSVCYLVGYYKFTVTLPPNNNGYTLSSQVNYRIQGISNLQNFYSNIGATYTAEIPGIPAALNNSAQFTGSDLVVVCANNRFSYSFGATDADGDELRYSFCEAYRSSRGGTNVVAALPPPYQSVPYGNRYNDYSPLGDNVRINSQTGLITGIAPKSGMYVVTVCVEEIRNGIIIAKQRKDLQLNIAPCNVTAAVLEPEYMLCNDTKTISLVNLSTSPLIRNYFWEISNSAGTTLFTSAAKTPTYTFPDTGLYKIKLWINRGEACSDSTTSIARVYPGFFPTFNFAGICFNKQTAFYDLTSSVYGTVNSWNWDFGSGETSEMQNPTFTFSAKGTMDINLIVTNSLGCRDAITKSVAIVTEPPAKLAFKDTLICRADSVMLRALGEGKLTWTSSDNITNTNSPSPTVSPAFTTFYFVNVNADGCINNDTVLVRVTDRVNLRVMSDTTICRGDTLQLSIQTDALTYLWTPALQLINPTAAQPFAFANNKTTFTLKASIGGCSITDSVMVSTVPYPTAYAGKDTIICYNTFVQLKGVTDANTLTWTPATSLNLSTVANPVATPPKTTNYILNTYDTRGCPKPGRDTVLVTVLPAISAFAGRDTSAVLGQPIQLNASGGSNYFWSPGTGLSSTNTASPVALYQQMYNPIRYKVLVLNEANCVDSAFVTVKIFSSGPTIFVPNAFTPNADGRNDVLKPIAVGIKNFDFFKIYNRWGQEVFSTQIYGKGWDGTINGSPQTTGGYVWWVKATDFQGVPYFRKGTVILVK